MELNEWNKRLEEVRNDFLHLIGNAADSELDELEVRFFGRKGRLSLLLRGLKDFPPEERGALGAIGNAAKAGMRVSMAKRKGRSGPGPDAGSKSRVDLTLPGYPFPRGNPHPLTVIMDRLASGFLKLGFSMADAPLIEDDFHNFEALNFPPTHPARDMQDTFYLDAEDETGNKALLRTHTSPVQIRVLQAAQPPLRMFHCGRVFRSEAVDASHSFAFHQIEGFCVDKNVGMADLKWAVNSFMRDLFGSKIKTRFLPSYFPFVEPGAEVDMSCIFCKGGGGCPVCKGTGWLEMLGAGVIHPNVLKACGHDPEMWSGFAFGAGIERLAMLLFGINDMRTLYENDLRVLEQIR